jgi:6-phosphogluconolactonase
VSVHEVELRIESDEEAAARAVADLLTEAARAGEEIVFTGGTTPGRAYELAAELEADWGRAGAWWGDERCVPPDDQNSNFGLAQRTLFDKLEARPRVHRIRGEDDPDVAAGAYEDELRGTALDLLLLGLGPDGHVASLFPHSPGLEERERLVIAAEPKLEPYIERITLTPPALRAARRIVFLVTGEDKADAVARALSGDADPGVPGSLIRAESGETLAVLDRAAASRLRD